MDTLSWYVTLGLAVTLIGTANLIGQGREPRSWRGVLALLTGAALWPLALAALWYAKWQEARREPFPGPDFLHVTPRQRWQLGRLGVTFQPSERRVLPWRLGRRALWLDPRWSLLPPVLPVGAGWRVNLLCCQILIVPSVRTPTKENATCPTQLKSRET